MKQLNLFDNSDRLQSPKPETLKMDPEALTQWKSRIHQHQQSVRRQKPPQQQTLFNLPRTTWHTSDDIDPFALELHTALFYRRPQLPQPMDDTTQGCLYFVIDNAVFNSLLTELMVA